MPATSTPRPTNGLRGNDVEMFSGHDQTRTTQHWLDSLFDSELARLRVDLQQKVVEWQDAIHPHTDEGGDPYYIGDAYEPINSDCAREWRLQNPGPYLRYVQYLSREIPSLEYLTHWMEVSTSPLKWKYLRKCPGNRAERAQRVRAFVIDYSSKRLLRSVMCGSKDSLHDALRGSLEPHSDCQLRVIVMEDLSRDAIELLGGLYDIDPRLFRSLINDNLFYNIRDRWAEVPSLLLEDRMKSFSTFSFLHARYYASEQDFTEAERESGMFNVLRRMDSDNTRKTLQDGPFDIAGASVSLGRSKTAIWTKPASPGCPAIAILLTDPSVAAGIPLWRGIEMPSVALSMNDTEEGETARVQGAPFFERVVHASSSFTPEELAQIARDVRFVGIPTYKICLKEWLLVIQYMNSRVRLTRWRLERPHFDRYPEGLDELLKKLIPWQRNLELYTNMVRDAMRWYIPCESEQTSSSLIQADEDVDRNGRGVLTQDFVRVIEQLQRTRARIDEVVADVASKIAQDQSRREIEARQESRGLARLSTLATIFIPLNFATSFFSMSSDFSTSSNTFWLFFAVGVPLTVVVIALVGLMQPDVRSDIRSRWNNLGWRRAIIGTDA